MAALEWEKELNYFKRAQKEELININKIIIPNKIWYKNIKSRLKSGKLPEWKRDLLAAEKIIHVFQDSIFKEHIFDEILNEFDAIAETSMAVDQSTISQKDKNTKVWVRLHSEFKHYYANEKNLNIFGTPPLNKNKELTDWINVNRNRYMKNELILWKMNALNAAGFKHYCLCTGRKIGIYAQRVNEYHKNFGSHLVSNKGEYTNLYKWQMHFISTASSDELNSFNELLPDLNEHEKQLLSKRNAVSIRNKKKQNFSMDKLEGVKNQEYLIKVENQNAFFVLETLYEEEEEEEEFKRINKKTSDSKDKFGSNEGDEEGKNKSHEKQNQFRLGAIYWLIYFCNIIELIEDGVELEEIFVQKDLKSFVSENIKLIKDNTIDQWKLKLIKHHNLQKLFGK
jgi:hypothetical protein